jgi:hypothetical protein
MVVMLKKIIIPFLIIALIAAGAVYYYVFVYSVQNHRNINDEDAITITADSLAQDFTNDESIANTKYLNKVLAVKGIVIDTASNQQGKPTVTIGNVSSMANVFVTLTDRPVTAIKLNDTIRVKGICSGFLSDIVINDATIVE